MILYREFLGNVDLKGFNFSLFKSYETHRLRNETYFYERYFVKYLNEYIPLYLKIKDYKNEIMFLLDFKSYLRHRLSTEDIYTPFKEFMYGYVNTHHDDEVLKYNLNIFIEQFTEISDMLDKRDIATESFLKGLCLRYDIGQEFLETTKEDWILGAIRYEIEPFLRFLDPYSMQYVQSFNKTNIPMFNKAVFSENKLFKFSKSDYPYFNFDIEFIDGLSELNFATDEFIEILMKSPLTDLYYNISFEREQGYINDFRGCDRFNYDTKYDMNQEHIERTRNDLMKFLRSSNLVYLNGFQVNMDINNIQILKTVNDYIFINIEVEDDIVLSFSSHIFFNDISTEFK